LSSEKFTDPIIYWKDENIDRFETKLFSSGVECEFNEGWVDLAYMLKRGYSDCVKKLAKELDLKGDTELKPYGDKILHLCAQYGDEEMFGYFVDKLKANLN